MADHESLGQAAEPDIAALIAARPHLRMHPDQGLMLEGVPLATIAHDLGTPCWVYGAGTIRARLAALRDALAGAGLARAPIHYAVKANDHLAILAIMAAEGAGADVVSAGELARALHAGIPASRIVFSGVGKTAADLRLAVGQGIAQINVESREELGVLSAIAVAEGRVVDLVIRVNPDVDAGTHAKITTGRAENKFGIAWDEAEAVYAYATTLPGLRPLGLAVHIGSQILSVAPFRAAFGRVAGLVTRLRAAGHVVTRVDCGGGIGIPSGAPSEAPSEAPSSEAGGAAPSLAGFAAALAETLGGLGLDLMLEPGRWLVAPAGVLLASVVLAKQTGARRFVVLDAAMNDLVRPAMYDAWHGIVPVSAADAAGPAVLADIVGPVCETGDTFARDRSLPLLGPEALVAILDAGAYGAVMSSTYNARPLAAAALVDGIRYAMVSPRQEIAALWSRETVPAWFSASAAPSP
jgi:diaminopimelate decarboxylase